MTGYEAVIGMEVHVQLRTAQKLFCADSVAFGDDPNTHVCPVCLGLPGALPVANAEAVGLAVRAALALGCTVHPRSVWARKNYFYPDLPKGYQITQFESPLASGGILVFDGPDGERSVRLRRIHLEEDAGKSLHDRVPGATAVDLNRAGTPLVEIVSEPDLRGPEDTRAYLTALKQVLEYLDVSDCNMEEGSLRADANVSVRAAGSPRLGTKTEIKNVNSFSGIQKALALEIRRQSEVLAAGERVEHQTLLWDDHRNLLRPMRSKEESHDYRYFPDPDLPPVTLAPGEIHAAREALPELPRPRRMRLRESYGLPEMDADVLTRSAAVADYFEELAGRVGDPKIASNWVMGPVLRLLNQRAETADGFPVRPDALADLVALATEGVVSLGAARDVLRMMAEEGLSARALVDREGLAQVRDESRLEGWVEDVIRVHPDAAERYRSGEAKVLGFLVGQVMRASRGKADPRRVSELLRAALE